MKRAERRRRSLWLAGTAAAALFTFSTSQALAWGATGHRLIGEAGAAALPPEVPAFLRTPQAVQQIGELAREPDRSKGSGDPHDADLDPGHFVDIDDQGRVNGGPAIDALPPTREGYEAALRAVGTDMGRSGYLPYSIEDGFLQLAKDFAYWRGESAALRNPATGAADRAWIARDLKLREAITLRDLGYWAHFVGDASQPLHASIHYNGWGNYPNPEHFTQERIHAPFEGAFVHDQVTLPMVQAAMRPYRPCTDGIAACTAAYLAATNAEVAPLYRLWGAGGFADRDPRGVAFATARLAAGASELRDLVVDAWRASEDGTVGYPAVPVKAVEAGQPLPIGSLYGED